MSENFGDRLRATRELRGLSQTDLAKRTGLQPSAVSHFETGNRAPSFDNLKRLADALSVSIDYLLGRSATPDVATPAAEQIFRDFSKMTASDQETLAQMAALLARKNTDKKDGDPKE
jgi:transcriptional regulator with XRE-family HTH domain